MKVFSIGLDSTYLTTNSTKCTVDTGDFIPALVQKVEVPSEESSVYLRNLVIVGLRIVKFLVASLR
jgi:hypothetical protein